MSYDVAIIGGGLVGAAVAFGLAERGQRVAVLDEGDTAYRASRGNFALVWVQSKGLGMPAYSRWTRESADRWPAFAATLREESGIDVAHRRPGGLTLVLNDAEWERRESFMRRLAALLLFGQCAAAACSGELNGSSTRFWIAISDRGCEFPQVMIQATPVGPEGEGLEPLAPIALEGECVFVEGVSLECRAEGRSALAGASYKATRDTNPVCPNRNGPAAARGIRYTCTRGCDAGAPPYLYWSPYEC